jgi:isoquinoline 1-oxidoreductase subunit alpha
MPLIQVIVNEEKHAVEASEEMPLLWVLRDRLGLTGTKFGCGVGVCGACTVHLNGEAVRACMTPLSAVGGQKVVTIEGLSKDQGHPCQRAWLAEEVAQCGYCQPGQIMSAAALLRKRPHPTDAEINQAMADNICRCGTYQRIRRAIHLAAAGATR